MNQQNESAFNDSEPDSAVVQKKSAASCIVYDSLSYLLLLVLLLLGGGYYGYRLLQDQLNQYTSETPADLPVIEYTAEQLADWCSSGGRSYPRALRARMFSTEESNR